MHPNPAFRGEPTILHLNLARTRAFGMLCLNGPVVPMLSHIPFLLDEAGTQAELHLARNNPIVDRVTGPTDAVIAVNGPDGYVSPDWYGDPAQVPTWNYVAIHLIGVLEPIDTLEEHLERVTESFESRLAPKAPWTMEKMPRKKLDAMKKAIQAFRLRITSVEGTWNINQNKSKTARVSASDHMRHSPLGQQTDILADLMGAPWWQDSTP